MNARNDRLDSAKGLLIALVVAGHWLEASSYWEDGLIRYVLTTIYAFHMPAFVFLAGITSRPGKLRYRIALLVSLLLVFQCLYAAYLPMTDSHKQFEWADPFWILWFLSAMVWWLLALAIARHSPRIALAVSVVIALFSGAVPAIDHIPAFDRALYFLPWFIAGYALGQTTLERGASARKGTTIALSATSLLLTTALWYSQIGPGWLYGSHGFAVLEVSILHGVLMRALLMLIAFVMMWTLFAIVGNLRNVMSVAGKRSLAIYLLHGFLILAITPSLGKLLDQYGSVVALMTGMAGTWLIVQLLTFPIFDRGLRAMGDRGAGVILNTLDQQRFPG